MKKKGRSSIKSFAIRVLETFNDKKINQKMFYTYIFCVLLPVIITNVVIITFFVKDTAQKDKEVVDNIVDSVSYTISNAVESALNISIDLYTRKSINYFLMDEYKNAEDYLLAYENVLEDFSVYAGARQMVSGITFYADNATMINGGNFFRTEEVQDEEWYLKYSESELSIFACSYYNDTFYDVQRKRKISIIRNLDYYGEGKEQFVKLDLNFEQLYTSIKQVAMDAEVLVCDGNKIMFDSKEATSFIRTYYPLLEEDMLDNVQAEKIIFLNGMELTIYVMDYHTGGIDWLLDIWWMIFILFIVDACLPAIMIMLFSQSITQRMLLLGKFLNRVKEEKFEIITQDCGRDEIGELIQNYNVMVSRMKELIEFEYKNQLRQQELILAKQQAELLALHSQINPHFLFNVLESIRMRSLIKEEKETAQMIEGLAHIMRRSADWKEDCISIKEEVGFVEEYLKLQRYRYGDVFSYRIRLEPELIEFQVPGMALATFVENACVHGLDRAGHEGSIYTSVYREGDNICLEVEDTGVGMSREWAIELSRQLNESTIADLQKSASVGMMNALIRLKIMYGERVEVVIISEEGEGTCVTVIIPIAKEGLVEGSKDSL